MKFFKVLILYYLAINVKRVVSQTENSTEKIVEGIDPINTRNGTIIFQEEPRHFPDNDTIIKIVEVIKNVGCSTLTELKSKYDICTGNSTHQCYFALYVFSLDFFLFAVDRTNRNVVFDALKKKMFDAFHQLLSIYCKAVGITYDDHNQNDDTITQSNNHNHDDGNRKINAKVYIENWYNGAIIVH